MTILRSLLCIFVLGGVAACAPRGVPQIIPLNDAASVTRVYVAALRDRDTGLSSFGADRTTEMAYLHTDISIPPSHVSGEIEWPGRSEPDPLKHFGVIEARRYPAEQSFFERLRQHEAPAVMIFVHGYNVNPAEAVYGMAQMHHDYDQPVLPLAFLWPSAGDPLGYVYDRQSALFARDQLVALINDVHSKTGKPIVILAHSLGSFLTMEAMRQNDFASNRSAADMIGGVFLMSPDLEPDVFEVQIDALDRVPENFVVLAAKKDPALNFSSLITGKRPRVGQITDPEAWAERGVTVIDLSAFRGTAGSAHSIAVTSPEAIEFLREYLEEIRPDL
ncbi:MAG: alpha/beta fold hydrolase [Pseudomonadota bacterium]